MRPQSPQSGPSKDVVYLPRANAPASYHSHVQFGDNVSLNPFHCFLQIMYAIHLQMLPPNEVLPYPTLPRPIFSEFHSSLTITPKDHYLLPLHSGSIPTFIDGARPNNTPPVQWPFLGPRVTRKSCPGTTHDIAKFLLLGSGICEIVS